MLSATSSLLSSARELIAISWRRAPSLANRTLVQPPQLSQWPRPYSDGAVNIFDRTAKRIQRNRAASGDNPELYDYLKDEVASQLVDRISDIARHFPLALDVGCGRGHVAKQLTKDYIDRLYQCDYAEVPLSQSSSAVGVPTHRLVADEEFLPLASNTFDLATSCLSLHWINDLPAAFKEINRVLKPDGCFIGCMFAGDTLFELRCSLQIAQTEREGGFSPHISPFVGFSDIGSLLSRSGFVLTTVDADEIVVNYPTMFELMYDLKGMGEGNGVRQRPGYIKRDTLKAAAAIYNSHYGNHGDDGTVTSVPATFQLVHFIGWKPDKSQSQPARRGSASVSLKDIGHFATEKKDN